MMPFWDPLGISGRPLGTSGVHLRALGAVWVLLGALCGKLIKVLLYNSYRGNSHTGALKKYYLSKTIPAEGHFVERLYTEYSARILWGRGVGVHGGGGRGRGGGCSRLEKNAEGLPKMWRD